ncbi:hypothetical protein LSTR_LSTR003056 [Laodelphax striatellus]|uniref:Uncharacterized protein n=1 Tax=Laodelphax striatellus TaxID=195883 RepID=A0A482XUG9_LAOST|nr:hypothetical protein LSTR_LSTR003056 [Laodelphax striatellus]
MILLRVHLLLLLGCILYVACVEGARKAEPKEKAEAEEKTGDKETTKDAKDPEQNKQVQRRYWFPKKLLHKAFHVVGDAVKDVWNRHVTGYRNPGKKGRKIRLPDTFFVVEREYKGLAEMRTATSFHNVKAWRVQLKSIHDDISERSKTVRFIEKKMFDEEGEPINYLGEIKLETPDRTKWKFLNQKREEEEKTNGNEEGEEEEKEVGEDEEEKEKGAEKKDKPKKRKHRGGGK